jgi:4-amino-4-deoxy-L-arabinose transferase-like glycosyltransferase
VHDLGMQISRSPAAIHDTAGPGPDPFPPSTASGRGWSRPAPVAILVLLWLAATAWMRPFMLPDEGRYVGVAWEMIRSGDWLTPTLNGLPFFHKPPLFYWITAASMSAFGPHEWAARAASILGGTIGAVGLFVFARRWSGERVARLALLALMAQPLFYVGSQFANLDMLVAGCITATILLAADAVLSADRGLPYQPALLGAYAMAAFGVLAKGLIGAVLPTLVLLPWLFAMRRPALILTLISWRGLALFLLIAGPWFLAMESRFPDFLNYFFVVQHFKRFTSGGFNNVQPFWFYPVVLSLLSLPWLPWMARLLIRGRATSAMGPVELLMLAWAGMVIAFFSLPQSKLVGYVMPAVPPMAVLMALGYLCRGEPSPRTRRWWQISAAATVAATLATIAGLSLFPPNSTRGVALRLLQLRAPGDSVFMLGKFYGDVPLYARLGQPSEVVEDWLAADLADHDDQRKELADAGRFAPGLAASLLVTPAALPSALCRARIAWLIGPADSAGKFPFLRSSNPVYAEGETALWKVDPAAPGAMRSALGCESGVTRP